MAEILLYHKLLEFPLFLGMKHKDIMELVAHTRFGFMKEDANKTIVEADSPCDSIIMLVNGQIESITASADKNFMVEEVFNSPFTLQPEHNVTQALSAPPQKVISSLSANKNCAF